MRSSLGRTHHPRVTWTQSLITELISMEPFQLNWIVNFIWSIADDVPRFTRHLYQPPPLRALAEIRAEILALERETEGLLGQIIGGKK